MSFDLSEQALIKTVVKVTQGTVTKKLDAEWDANVDAIEGEVLRDQAKRARVNLYGITEKGGAVDP